MGYYKGRSSIQEVIDMPNRLFHTLYANLLRKLSTPEGQEQAATEKVVEEIEEVSTQ